MHESDACSVRWHHIERLYNKSEWGVPMQLYAVKNRDGYSECYKIAVIRSSKYMNKYSAMTGQQVFHLPMLAISNAIYWGK